MTRTSCPHQTNQSASVPNLFRSAEIFVIASEKLNALVRAVPIDRGGAAG